MEKRTDRGEGKSGNMDEKLVNTSEEAEIIVWPRRWLILVLFMFFGYSNQLQYVAYVTIVDQSKKYFDANSLMINLLPSIYPLLYVFFVFPACKLVGSLGLRKGILLGSGLNAVGALIKMITLVAPSYFILIGANLFNGFAQLLFLGLPPLVASVWFPVQERALATALGVLIGFVGMATGLFYSPRIMDDVGCNGGPNTPAVKGGPEECTKGFLILFSSQVGLSCLPFLLILCFVKDAPPTPPSATANSGAEEIPSIIAVLKRLLKNKQFVLATQIFGSIVGLFTALATVLTQMLEPLGFSESQSAYLAFAGIMAGALNCAVVSPIIDKYRKYKLPWACLMTSVLVLTSIMLICAFLLEGSSLVTAGFVLIIILEMSILPQFPVALDLSVELTYPEPESISGSFMMISLSLWSVVGTFIFSAILGNNPTKTESQYLLLTMVCIITLALTAMTFLKEDLKRLKHERGDSENVPVRVDTEGYGSA